MSARTVLLCLVVVTVGCAAFPGGGQSDGPPPLTEPGSHPGMTADLDVSLHALDPVHVTVTELGQRGRGVVVDRAYTDRSKLEFGDDGSVFRENGDYRVVIRVNGTVRWNETVGHNEAYDLRVESNGSVTVMMHAKA